MLVFFFFFKQKTAYEMRISDWSSDVCSSDLSLELPVLSGSVGPRAIDVSRLYAETGCFTYDPGFTSTASCDSDITYIDGEEGILMHRGYLIEDLAEHSDFMDVCYLLLHGELPTAKEKRSEERRVGKECVSTCRTR